MSTTLNSTEQLVKSTAEIRQWKFLEQNRIQLIQKFVITYRYYFVFLLVLLICTIWVIVTRPNAHTSLQILTQLKNRTAKEEFDKDRVKRTWEQYVQLHQDILRNSSNSTKQFIILVVQDGWGNRFLTMMSTLLLAMLTERALLIEDDGQKFTDVLSDRIDWHLQFNKTSSVYLNSPYLDLHGPSLSNDKDDIMIDLLCSELNNGSWKSPIVRLSSNQYFGVLLLNNPFFQSRIYGQEGFTFGHTMAQLSSFVFKLPNDIRKLVDSMHLKFAGSYVVGIQARTETFCKSVDCQKSIIACAEMAALLRPANKRSMNIIFFIASDSYAFRTLANASLSVLSDGTRARVLWVDPDEEIDINKARYLPNWRITTLADIWLLSIADDIVRTGWSTFGVASQVLHDLNALVVNSQGGCVRDLNSNPCFHMYSQWVKDRRLSCPTGVGRHFVGKEQLIGC